MNQVIIVNFLLSFVFATTFAARILEGELYKRATCRDTIPTGSCEAMKNRYCNHKQWSSWMSKNCAKTCNKCPKPSPSTSSNCDPNKPDGMGCSEWKGKGFCEDRAYQKFMSEKCPITCGLCPGLKITKPKPEIVNVNIRECLQAHNSYRALHGAGPLTWDPSVAKKAQDYALELATKKYMKHDQSIRGIYGENLAYSYSSNGFTCKEATKNWYDEVKDYSFWNPGFSSATGHFTQVVWKATKRLGVGIAKNGYRTYVVARYSPPGNVNMMGQFAKNVGRRQNRT